ncbi:hypothetical protein SNE40_003012 [Patella caerulea]|uniref:Tyr recombinase domain-containing protein n=1 Tax=Patella caerulea TaxID=87958 RepID=A0AAN8Q838_PATCE
MLNDLLNKYESCKDLLIVRNLTMILIGFAGFLRYDELSSLKAREISLSDDYLKIFICNSKTDKHRQGNEILKGTGIACPVTMFKRYIALANIELDSSYFIFRPVFRSKGLAKLIYQNKKLSYTAARQNIVSLLKSVNGNLKLGLHSLRSGGATQAARARVNERCIRRHGGWKSDISKDGYVSDSLENRLLVSQSLRL